MKFEGSEFEVRYNLMWNTVAVPADEQIKKMLNRRGFFHFDAGSYVDLIKEYGLAAKNIINNLLRQSTNFEDVDYVQTYIQSTLNAVSSDFEEYRGALFNRLGADSAPVLLIDQLKRELEVSINEYNTPLQSPNDLTDDVDVFGSSDSSHGYVSDNGLGVVEEIIVEDTQYRLEDDFDKLSQYAELNDDDFISYINSFSK